MEVECSHCGHKFEGVMPKIWRVNERRFHVMSTKPNIVGGVKANGYWVFECPKCKEKNRAKTS